MLRINNSYSLIRKNQIDKEWLEAFIESAYQNNVRLDKDWLSQFADLIHNNEAATAKAA